MLPKNILVSTDYDYKYDIFTITKREKYNYNTSVELEPGLILDFDDDGVPASFEILDASKLFNIKNKQYLSNPKDVQMFIKITEQMISIEVKVVVMVHQKEKVSVFDFLAVNDIKIPSLNLELATA
ncbi:MAG: DUF2283 domain-containing protein [Methanobrevibacter sp. CfCl-M3]